MERNKTKLLLLLHVILLQIFVVQMEEKPTFPKHNLTCHNDFSQNINCVWNRKNEFDRTDNCKIHANLQKSRYLRKTQATCTMKVTDVSKPELNTCNLDFKASHRFKTNRMVDLNLSCSRWEHPVKLTYSPVNHVKPNPPEKPNVNQTTVQLKCEANNVCVFDIQWKQEDQLWNDPSVQNVTNPIRCKLNCTAELNPDSLIQGESYRMRIRMRFEIPMSTRPPILSKWSEWSPDASWISLVGRRRQQNPKSGGVGVLWMIAAAAAPFTLILILILRTNRTTWVFIIKLIQGPPLPNPAKSFLKDENIQKYQSSFFTSESYFSVFKPLDIPSVEVICSVDDVKQELLPSDKSIRDFSQDSSTSSFSNPSYSQLCPVLPSLPAGNLEPCAADSPYGPAGGHDQSTNTQQDVEKQRGNDVNILELFSKASNSEPLLVSSDYEKVDKLQSVECNRLQSVDSGMCSGEEVSQESLEPDSITQNLDHEPENKNGDCFEKLFGPSNTGDSFSKGFIEVCSDYEQVQKVQVEIPNDGGVDSDLGFSTDQQLSPLCVSTPSTHSLSDTPAPVLLLPSFTSSLLNFTKPGSSPGPGPLAALITQTVMSNNSSLEPSGDGYLPVTQEEC